MSGLFERKDFHFSSKFDALCGTSSGWSKKGVCPVMVPSILGRVHLQFVLCVVVPQDEPT